jgi:hypothetical protein
MLLVAAMLLKGWVFLQGVKGVAGSFSVSFEVEDTIRNQEKNVMTLASFIACEVPAANGALEIVFRKV